MRVKCSNIYKMLSSVLGTWSGLTNATPLLLLIFWRDSGLNSHFSGPSFSLFMIPCRIESNLKYGIGGGQKHLTFYFRSSQLLFYVCMKKNLLFILTPNSSWPNYLIICIVIKAVSKKRDCLFPEHRLSNFNNLHNNLYNFGQFYYF